MGLTPPRLSRRRKAPPFRRGGGAALFDQCLVGFAWAAGVGRPIVTAEVRYDLRLYSRVD